MKKNMLFRLPIFFFVFFSTTVFTQNIVSGIITEASGTALIGANVVILGTSEGTTSDVNGKYELTTSASFPLILKVSYVGFQTKEITIDRPTSSANITLTEGILTSDQVIISASRRREKIQEAPASVSLITARDLEVSPNENPVRNLINEPGVSIQQQSAGRINVHLRGDDGLVFGSASYAMLDYKPLGGLGDVYSNLNSPVNSIDLDRIEVVRGPSSALYGPGVTAGVIHFISKSAIDQPGTTIELMGGELSTIGISARHAAKFSDKFGFKINAAYKRGDEFTLDPNDPLDALQIAKLQSTVSVPSISDGVIDATLPQRQILSASDLDPDGDGNPMQDYWKSTLLNGTLEFRPQSDFSVIFSGGLNSASAVFYNAAGEGLAQSTESWIQGRVQKNNFFAQLAYRHNNYGTEKKPLWLYQTGESAGGEGWFKYVDAQVQYNFDIPSFFNSEWTTGFDYRLAQANTSHIVYGRFEDDDDFSVAGGYVQAKLHLMNKLDFVMAARADRFNVLDKTAFSPRAVLLWKPNLRHNIRGGFNRAVGTPTPLELHLDQPITTIIPGAFDIWLVGSKIAQTFGDNPEIVFNGLLPFPSLPAGTPGLPLAYVQGAVSEGAISALTQSWAADPVLGPLVPSLTAYLSTPSNFVGGTGGTFAGINLFNGLPLGILDAPSAKLRIEDTWEFGYKGLINDKFSVAIDVYNRKIDGFALFTAISPSYTLLNADEIPGALENAIGANFSNYLTDLLTPLVGDQIPDMAALEEIVASASGVTGDTYSAGAAGFLESISGLINGAILATTPTDQVPANGIPHVASGFRTFEPYNYWGTDISMSYYINNDLSFNANYSWLSKTIFDLKIVDVDGTETISLLHPPNKYRLGLKYIPESGLRANVSFQHDPSYQVYLGQYTGPTDEKNLFDASVGYKFDNGLMVNLSAQNLFDNKYRTFPNFPKIGRRVLTKLTYTF